MRTRTTTLDELNEDELGNADAPPHHHGKLTTRTTTRRRRGGAQGNRRTRRRRGRHHRLGTRVRAEDDDSKHSDMELLHRNHGNRAATLGRGGGWYDLRRQEQVAATGCRRLRRAAETVLRDAHRAADRRVETTTYSPGAGTPILLQGGGGRRDRKWLMAPTAEKYSCEDWARRRQRAWSCGTQRAPNARATSGED